MSRDGRRIPWFSYETTDHDHGPCILRRPGRLKLGWLHVRLFSLVKLRARPGWLLTLYWRGRIVRTVMYSNGRFI